MAFLKSETYFHEAFVQAEQHANSHCSNVKWEEFKNNLRFPYLHVVLKTVFHFQCNGLASSVHISFAYPLLPALRLHTKPIGNDHTCGRRPAYVTAMSMSSPENSSFKLTLSY